MKKTNERLLSNKEKQTTILEREIDPKETFKNSVLFALKERSILKQQKIIHNFIPSYTSLDN